MTTNSSSEGTLALFADLLRQALEYVEDGGEVGGKGLSSDALELSRTIRAALAGYIARDVSGRALTDQPESLMSHYFGIEQSDPQGAEPGEGRGDK